MNNENENSSSNSLISSIIPFKLKIGIIIGITTFFIIILIPISVIMMGASLFSDEDEDKDKDNSSSSSSSQNMQTINKEATIIERGGLSFLSENSYFCYPITHMTGTTAKFGQSGANWSSKSHTGLDFVRTSWKSRMCSCS